MPRSPTKPPSQQQGPSAVTYVVAWFALVAFATASLLASHVSLGEWQVLTAFALAAAKAILVFAIFMHLGYGPPLHRAVITIAVCLFAMIILGVLADVATRSVASPYLESRNPNQG